MSDAQAAEFERHRTYLTGVAYRMLGTITDAEDAVQEAYLRFARQDAAPRDVRAWLTTTVARICLDELGSARARRETYVGPWLPEPVVGAPPGLDPADRVTLDESVSLAMLVVLESLSPAERTAFILREVLGLPYREVAQIVGRAEAACRQLVTRARSHVERHAPRFDVDRGQHADAVRAFRTACSRGSVGELVPDDRGRPDRTGIEKRQHSLQMRAIANNVGAQGLYVIAGRVKSLRRRCDPHQLAAGL